MCHILIKICILSPCTIINRTSIFFFTSEISFLKNSHLPLCYLKSAARDSNSQKLLETQQHWEKKGSKVTAFGHYHDTLPSKLLAYSISSIFIYLTTSHQIPTKCQERVQGQGTEQWRNDKKHDLRELTLQCERKKRKKINDFIVGHVVI